MNIQRIAVFYHPRVEATQLKAQELAGFLKTRVNAVWLSSAWEVEKNKDLLETTDLIVAVGGDGTLLRTAQVALARETPMVGINMGTLGFLTEIRADEALEKLPEILGGRGWLDERSTLEAEIIAAGASASSAHYLALNDVVVARGAIARLIQVETSLDGQLLTTYRADGVIVATATGSTGYSLAAGGPILHPDSTDCVLVPIVPHLGLNYSLVVAAGAEVVLQVKTTHQATLCIDGHINAEVANGVRIKVRHGLRKARFLRIQPRHYFYRSLEQKLRGKK